jgi:hypothetical protein
VAQRYRQALAGAPVFAISTVRDQIEIFQRLDLRGAFVTETLDVLGDLAPSRTQPSATPAKLGRVLLFTGHMVDAPGRPEPRFPPGPKAEAEARRLIAEAVVMEREREPGSLLAVAGGACGGDILFHEVCVELSIPAGLFLALPKDEFCRESVQHGGPLWVERFYRLCERLPPRVLADTPVMPAWLRGRKDYNIWQRNNLWMLFNALSFEPARLSLLALWDQGHADGPGGTDDLVAQVLARGYKVERLPAERLKLVAGA